MAAVDEAHWHYLMLELLPDDGLVRPMLSAERNLDRQAAHGQVQELLDEFAGHSRELAAVARTWRRGAKDDVVFHGPGRPGRTGEGMKPFNRSRTGSCRPSLAWLPPATGQDRPRTPGPRPPTSPRAARLSRPPATRRPPRSGRTTASAATGELVAALGAHGGTPLRPTPALRHHQRHG